MGVYSFQNASAHLARLLPIWSPNGSGQLIQEFFKGAVGQWGFGKQEPY
jgi:hypothetical protein